MPTMVSRCCLMERRNSAIRLSSWVAKRLRCLLVPCNPVSHLHMSEVELDQEFVDVRPPRVQHRLETHHDFEGLRGSGRLVGLVVRRHRDLLSPYWWVLWKQGRLQSVARGDQRPIPAFGRAAEVPFVATLGLLSLVLGTFFPTWTWRNTRTMTTGRTMTWR
jgi:hypothetical protein